MPSTPASLADPAQLKPAAPAWLKCRSCGRPLVRISVHEGATCLSLFDGQFLIREAAIACGCGAERQFRSMRVLTAGHV